MYCPRIKGHVGGPASLRSTRPLQMAIAAGMPLLQFQESLPDLSAEAASAAKVEGVRKLLIRSKDVITQ